MQLKLYEMFVNTNAIDNGSLKKCKTSWYMIILLIVNTLLNIWENFMTNKTKENKDTYKELFYLFAV